MKNKFSHVLLVLLISFCSSSSNDNTDTIRLNNLNLKPLIEEDKIQLEADFLIINYWASWCLECIEEHELLISLAESQKLEGKVVMVSFQDNIENSIENQSNIEPKSIKHLTFGNRFSFCSQQIQGMFGSG